MEKSLYEIMTLLLLELPLSKIRLTFFFRQGTLIVELCKNLLQLSFYCLLKSGFSVFAGVCLRLLKSSFELLMRFII